MVERAAALWEASSDDIELSEGVFRHKSDPELSVTFKELADNLKETGGPVLGRANLNAKGPGAGFATNIVDLEVDPEDRQGNHTAVYCFPGRGQGYSPQLRRGADAGRRGPGHRLGPQ